MSQATFDDDELFGEAAGEMRTDVERHLEQAWTTLPAPEDIWTVDADNTLGVLNALRSAMDTGDAEDHLRDAKKWYTMGDRAGAFEDAGDLEAEVDRLETVLTDIQRTHEQVGDLAATIPELRGALEDAHEAIEDED